MSTQVEINGVNFLPVKDAAKAVSYTRDYVARLAREQKIVASQIGRQWFIDIVSLKNFADASLLELSVRKQQLSTERKHEQLVKQAVLDVKKEIKSKGRSVRLRAQLVAVFVLGFGLLSGIGLYTTSALLPVQNKNVADLGAIIPTTLSINQETPVSQEMAFQEIDTTVLEIATPQDTTLFTTVSEAPLFIDEAETRSMSVGNTEGIFLLASDSEVRNAKDVAALFSDQVTVEFLDETTGVVTYTQAEGETNKFPFVSVPVSSNQAGVNTEAR